MPRIMPLASTLFNWYTNDLPVTKCRRFTYADDICCTVQAKSFEEVERTLTSDMEKIAEYCRRWRLKPSAPKKQCQAYFTCTAKKSHDWELKVNLNGQWLTHDPHLGPLYIFWMENKWTSNFVHKFIYFPWSHWNASIFFAAIMA